MANFWPTLASYVEGLEQAGKLIRVTTPINKDTELHPLVRLQFRGLPEKARKAFLFENVIDSRGRPVRVYYATQVEVNPPTIVLSTSAPRSIPDPYQRYLVNALRKATPLTEVPIRLLVRGRGSGDEAGS